MSNLRSSKSADENPVVKRFIDEVNELIPTKDRSTVFDALKRYQSSMELKRLLQDLTQVLDEPSKLEIFEHIRPLIPPKHQMEYDKLAPAPPGRKLRVIKLHRRGTESLGFAVRGGFEHGIGVFVSHVAAGSQAERQGLRVGDELVRVNGYTIAEAIHEEVLNLIKGRDEVELRVTNIGMLPIKENVGDTVTWRYVEKASKGKNTEKNVPKRSHGAVEGEEVKLFANLRTAPSLGCSIVSGPGNFKGIFVAKVTEGGLGEEIGMELGDQIVSVNGTSFLDISRNEAVVALKGSKELNLVIRKRAGLPILQQTTGHAVPRNHAPPSEESSSHHDSMDTYPEPGTSSSIPPPPPLEPSYPSPSQEQSRVSDTPLNQLISVKTQPSTDVEYAVVQKRRNITEEDQNVSSQTSDETDDTNEENKLREELQKKVEEEMRMKEEIRKKLEEENIIREEIRKKMFEKEERKRMENEQRIADERKQKQQNLEHEREATERLQKVLQDKLAQQKLEEEKLRQEVYEANRKKRNAMEHKLLQEIRRHQGQGQREHMLRLQRHRQEEDEIRREADGTAGGSKFLSMLQRSLNLPHKTKRDPCEQSYVLKGRGAPLKKQNFGLLGADVQQPDMNLLYPQHEKNREVTYF